MEKSSFLDESIMLFSLVSPVFLLSDQAMCLSFIRKESEPSFRPVRRAARREGPALFYPGFRLDSVPYGSGTAPRRVEPAARTEGCTLTPTEYWNGGTMEHRVALVEV